MLDQILLADAAKLVGKAPATLRRLVNDGKIPSTKDTQGRNRVRREDVIAFYTSMDQERASAYRVGAVQADRPPSSDERLIAALRDQITDLTNTVTREREEITDLRAQVKRLEADLSAKTSAFLAALTEKTGTSVMNWIRTKSKG